MRKPFYWKARKGWYVRIVNGKKSTNHFLSDDESDAYREWHRMKEAAKRSLEPDSVLVSDVVHRFATRCEQRVKDGQMAAKTMERAIEYLAAFLSLDAIEEVTVDNLKPYHVTEWLDKQSGWNATTKHHAAAAVKRAIKWAYDEGRISRNPLHSLSVPKGDGRDFLIDDELYLDLLNGASDPKYKRKRVRSFKLFLMAMKMSGCRPGEVIGLKISNVDKKVDTWVIRKHKNRKKQSRPRVVYLSPCLQTLTRIVAHSRKSGALFQADYGESWTYEKVRRRFHRLKQRKGVESECVLYSFRHTWITSALLAGVELATVAEMAGTSIQMIERHYGHLDQRQERMKAAAIKIAEKNLSS